jgi:hypothetical protein
MLKIIGFFFPSDIEGWRSNSIDSKNILLIIFLMVEGRRREGSQEGRKKECFVFRSILSVFIKLTTKQN